MLDDFSPAVLFASIVVSSIGLGYFLYGKKAGRPIELAIGLVLMIYPYFVSSVGWMLGICALLIAGVWLARRAGN